MDMHSYPRGRALHEAAMARARQLRAETMDGYFAAAGRRLQAARRALRDLARRAHFRHAPQPAAWAGNKANGAAPCPR